MLVEAGEGVTEIDRQPCGQAGCEAADPAFPPEQARVPASRAVVAAVQSIAACEGSPPGRPCSPVVMRLVKSSRSRKVPWPMSSVRWRTRQGRCRARRRAGTVRADAEERAQGNRGPAGQLPRRFFSPRYLCGRPASVPGGMRQQEVNERRKGRKRCASIESSGRLMVHSMPPSY